MLFGISLSRFFLVIFVILVVIVVDLIVQACVEADCTARWSCGFEVKVEVLHGLSGIFVLWLFKDWFLDGRLFYDWCLKDRLLDGRLFYDWCLEDRLLDCWLLCNWCLEDWLFNCWLLYNWCLEDWLFNYRFLSDWLCWGCLACRCESGKEFIDIRCYLRLEWLIKRRCLNVRHLQNRFVDKWLLFRNFRFRFFNNWRRSDRSFPS